MATAREIKKRIRSVKNIAQITRALEAVSASRVRRAQARVLASRAYSQKAWEILLNIQHAASKGVPLHPLLTARDEIKQAMVVLITSDRGLAGAFNTNIIRLAQRFVHRLGKPVRFVTVGRKGRDALIRLKANVVAEFTGLPSDPRVADISPIARLAIDEYLSGTVDDVFVAYTDYINTLTQRPVVLSWLPLLPYATDDMMMAEMLKSVPQVSSGGADYEYEPNAQAILDEIVPRFTELQIYQAILESQASEHSARMVAMRNASDNAGQLINDYTLVYNKARQAAITAEILDIVGGAEALQASIDATTAQIETEMARAVYSAQVLSQPTNGTKTASKEKAAGDDDETLRAKPEPRPRKAKAGSEKADDLTQIEGIGPKMAAALKAAGIDTFSKLAAASEDELKAAIEAAGMRLAPSLKTWAEQAEYASKGDWDGLKELQDNLTGGRKS